MKTTQEEADLKAKEQLKKLSKYHQLVGHLHKLVSVGH